VLLLSSSVLRKRATRDKSLKRLKDAIRQKTPRKHGQCLSLIIANVNRTTRGCFEYFKRTSYTTVFRGLDGWLRRRRSILLMRHKVRRHCGLGTAHQRWPNAFFAEHGLFSMEAAHVRLRQSATR